MARGYSPAEAQEPCNRIWRVTTFCRGMLTSGEMLPTSTTVPPFRTLSTDAVTVSVLPTASTTASAPAPPVSCKTCAATSVSADKTAAPRSCASFSREPSTSATKTREHPAARKAWAASNPIIPAPTTSAVLPEGNSVHCNGCRFEHGSLRKRKAVGQAVHNARRDGHIFCKRTSAAILRARDTEHLPIVAEIDFTATAGRARAAVHGRIERDSITCGKIRNAVSERGDGSGAFVAHNNGRNATAGGAVVAVNITAANAAGGYADENFAGLGLRFGKFGHFELHISCEK
jgi:hypothetical protein